MEGLMDDMSTGKYTGIDLNVGLDWGMDYGDYTGGVRDSDDIEDNVKTNNSDYEDDNNSNIGDDDKENISNEHLHNIETQPHNSDAPLHKDAANPAKAPPSSSMYDWKLLDKVGNGKPFAK
ncbi:unnamed protein product [Linum trigynum]|uniref:Uncharacterized protein n=1 Tax=Linum trigynum TaxID=586398 RepID=A0AAV2F8W5_9ROSI